jgi:hypothetical protein
MSKWSGERNMRYNMNHFGKTIGRNTAIDGKSAGQMVRARKYETKYGLIMTKLWNKMQQSMEILQIKWSYKEI